MMPDSPSAHLRRSVAYIGMCSWVWRCTRSGKLSRSHRSSGLASAAACERFSEAPRGVAYESMPAGLDDRERLPCAPYRSTPGRGCAGAQGPTSAAEGATGDGSARTCSRTTAASFEQAAPRPTPEQTTPAWASQEPPKTTNTQANWRAPHDPLRVNP